MTFHTVATKFVENTGNIVAVKEILGHSSLEMTMRYAHPYVSLKGTVESLTKKYSGSEHEGHKPGHISMQGLIFYPSFRTLVLSVCKTRRSCLAERKLLD